MQQQRQKPQVQNPYNRPQNDWEIVHTDPSYVKLEEKNVPKPLDMDEIAYHSNRQNLSPQNRNFQSVPKVETIRTFQKQPVGSKVVLYSSNESSVDDWRYLASNKKNIDLFKKQMIQVIAPNSQLEGALNYIFMSNPVKNIHKNVLEFYQETIKAVFEPFLEKLKLLFSMNSFNVDFNKSELHLGFNGNYQDFIEQSNELKVLIAAQDFITTIVDDYNKSISTYESPHIFPVLDKKKLRFLPEVNMYKDGSTRLTISLSSLFSVIPVGLAFAVGYLAQRYSMRQTVLGPIDAKIQQLHMKKDELGRKMEILQTRMQSGQIQRDQFQEELYDLETEFFELKQQMANAVNERKIESYRLEQTKYGPNIIFGENNTMYLEDQPQS